MLSINCPQIWNIEKGKDGEKEKVGDRPCEAQREKERQGARARDKKQRKHFWLQEQHENFVAGVRKREILVATNAS